MRCMDLSNHLSDADQTCSKQSYLKWSHFALAYTLLEISVCWVLLIREGKTQVFRLHLAPINHGENCEFNSRTYRGQLAPKMALGLC